MLTRSRRVLTAAVVGALALVLAGCGTSFNAQTNAIYQAGVGTNNRSSDVEILNALFVKNEDGSATLSAGMVNQTLETDRLTGVSVSTLAGTPVEVTFDGPVSVPARRLESLGTKPHVVIAGDELFAGQFLAITYTFANAGEVSMQLPIVTRTAIYAEVAEPKPAQASDDAAVTAEGETADEGDEATDAAGDEGDHVPAEDDADAATAEDPAADSH